jgi:energy-coupling factor transport system permease protein
VTALFAPVVNQAQRSSVLGRTSPLVKLGIAIAWLIGLALTLEVAPALALALVALVAGLELGRIPPDRLGRRLAPLALAALGIAAANLVFAAANANPAAHEIARIGPLRLTSEAALAAAGLAARIGAIVSVGAVFTLTTDATRLVDALVQQGRVSPRFAYGALAAYQAVPRLFEDLGTLRAVRRLRGLPEWRPSLAVGLLVRAIRHADQLAMAMDARAFGTGPRSTYRPIRWTPLDLLVALAGAAVLVVALVALP